MKRFYRLICIIFAVMLCFTAVACDGNKPGPDNPDNGNNGNNAAIETTGEKLFSGGTSDYTLVILKSNYGRSSTRAFGVGNNNGFAAFKNGYAGIGGTKVDADDLTHNLFLLKTTVNWFDLCEFELLT